MHSLTNTIGKPEYAVEELLQKSCCDRKQSTCFKKISQLQIEDCRKRIYFFHSETEQNQYVLDYMRDHAKHDKSVLYTISGQEVCEVCWRLTHGIRYNKFQCLKEKFRSGVVIIEHGLAGKYNTSESTLRLLEWMRNFIRKVGDSMPMSKAIHLPSCLARRDVYDLAKHDLTQGGLSCPSLSHMYELWRKEFPEVKIPKVCSYCFA